MYERSSRQKSYDDLKIRLLEFKVRELVFLKILPIIGVMRFDKSDKLSRRYVGPFEVLKRVGEVAYHLSLPPNLIAAPGCVSHINVEELHF